MTRPETGPMMAPEDWPGVFLRGDDAFGYSQALRGLYELLLRHVPPEDQHMDYVVKIAALSNMIELLDSCDMRRCSPQDCTQIEVLAQPKQSVGRAAEVNNDGAQAED